MRHIDWYGNTAPPPLSRAETAMALLQGLVIAALTFGALTLAGLMAGLTLGLMDGWGGEG